MDRSVNLPEILNHSKSVQEHLDYDPTAEDHQKRWGAKRYEGSIKGHRNIPVSFPDKRDQKEGKETGYSKDYHTVLEGKDVTLQGDGLI